MLITNGTNKKIRISVMKMKSEDEDYEAFAYIIAPSCGLSCDIKDESIVVSQEEI